MSHAEAGVFSLLAEGAMMNPGQEVCHAGGLAPWVPLWAAPFTVPMPLRGQKLPAATLWGLRKQEHEGHLLCAVGPKLIPSSASGI